MVRLVGLGLVALGVYFALQIESGGPLFLDLFLLVVGLWLLLGSLASFGGRAGGDSYSGGSGGDADAGDGDG